MIRKIYFLILVAFLIICNSIYAIDSVVFTDRILDRNGAGDINMLKDISPSFLEQYRQSNGGKIVFGIDINENANGTEKSETQAVTIESVTVTIIMDNQTYTYTNFTTETMAELLKEGATTRSLYYTCIGRSGSNSISGNEVQNRFDSTIKVVAPDALTGNITSAKVYIKLLDTKKGNVDPEMFYDYGAGFEDLAIINATDAAFLDQQKAGLSLAPDVIVTNPTPDPSTITSWIYYPSMNDYYFVGYEDLYPNRGDYDFNDMVFAYRVIIGLNSSNEVVKLYGISYIIAKGAAYSHDFHLKIQVPNGSGNQTITVEYPYDSNNQPIKPSVVTQGTFSSTLDMTLFSDSRNIINTITGLTNEQKTYFNTLLGVANTQVSPRVQFEANFTTRIPLANMEVGPFDPYIIVRNTTYDIHLIGKSPIAGSTSPNPSFKDDKNFPFAMLLPESWKFPYEKISLIDAYTNFYNYVTSGGTLNKDWYSFPVNGKVNNYTSRFWEW